MQPEIIDEIRDWHRKRRAAMEIRKRADLALGANLRTWLGWRKDMPEDERKRIAALAAELVGCGEKLAAGKQHPLAESEEFIQFRAFIMMAIKSRKPTDEFEEIATKEIEDIAATLPVWETFGADVRGFSARALGSIVGEAGDLSNYATHSKLWKRMCMAPFTKEGVTQSGKQWKVTGGLVAGDWIEFGYSGRRRSIMFVIEENLMRAAGHYHDAYLARKETLRNRAVAEGKTVAPSAKIPKGSNRAFVSDGQIHQQAKHYMGKRLLKHLWQAWRRAALVVADESSAAVLAAEIENASEKANSAVRASASPSLPSHDAGEATQRMPEKVTNALSPQKSKRACPDVPEKAVDLLPAGEAQGRLPNKAIRPRLPHKSKRAKGDVPEKATSRVPAGEAVKRAPAKAGRYLPPQKSLKRAVVQLPQKAVHCVPRRGGRNRVA